MYFFFNLQFQFFKSKNQPIQFFILIHSYRKHSNGTDTLSLEYSEKLFPNLSKTPDPFKNLTHSFQNKITTPTSALVL